MPWAQLDENVMDHPKFLALSDGAWRLWCEGNTYCQKHLTDGLVAKAALKGFRYYTRLRVKELVAELVPGKGPCWHEDAAGTITVHDYLDHNSSRAEVLKARADAKARKRRWKERVPAGVPDADRTANVSRDGEVRDPERSLGKKVGPEIPRRAGAFCQWYEDTHERLFHVGYMGTQQDYQKALELCAKFTDRQLQDGALVWFGMEDPFATEGTRSIPKFASRITGCLQQALARGIA